MKRIPEVFDCWFESGSMPFAQTGTYIQADFIDSGQYEQLGYNHEKEYAIRAEYISRLFLNRGYSIFWSIFYDYFFLNAEELIERL